MRIHLVQMCSSDSKKDNIFQVIDLLSKTSLLEGDAIFLPENSLFMRRSMAEKLQVFDLLDDDLKIIQDFARQKKVLFHLGGIPLNIEEKIYNTSLFFLPDGSYNSDYKKIHLFDVDVNPNKSIRESDSFASGSKTSIFTYQSWLFGQSVCYDIHFSNLYLEYAKQGVDVILIPSAFLPITGEAHWEILLRARAIESQAYIIASAQGGIHSEESQTWGESMVIDPWGKVLAKIDKHSIRPQIKTLVLDKSKIQNVRKKIPMKNHRKKI